MAGLCLQWHGGGGSLSSYYSAACVGRCRAAPHACAPRYRYPGGILRPPGCSFFFSTSPLSPPFNFPRVHRLSQKYRSQGGYARRYFDRRPYTSPPPEMRHVHSQTDVFLHLQQSSYNKQYPAPPLHPTERGGARGENSVAQAQQRRHKSNSSVSGRRRCCKSGVVVEYRSEVVGTPSAVRAHKTQPRYGICVRALCVAVTYFDP